MQGPKRVLIALDLPLIEGLGQSEYVRQTAVELRENGWDLALAAVPEAAGSPEVSDLGTYDYPLALDRTPFFVGTRTGGEPGANALPYENLAPRELDRVQRQLHNGLAEALLRFNPDVVHIHHAFLLVPAAALLGAICSIPFIVTAHGTDTKTAGKDRRYADIIGPSIRHASGVTAVSSAVRRELGELFGGDLELGVDVVPGGVDTGFYSPGAVTREAAARFEEQHGLEGRPLVLFAGSLTPEKGVDVLLDAIPSVRASFSDAEFRLIGEAPLAGQYNHLLKQRIEQSDNVELLGKVSRKELRDWYTRANVFVMPSRWEEGFGLVALEAMACGTPVVASRSEAMEGIIRDGINGYLADRGQPYRLAEKINKVLGEDEDGRRMMRAAARETVDDQYSWESVTNMLGPIYERALGPRHPFAFR